MDNAHKETDRLLSQLHTDLNAIYRNANKEIQREIKPLLYEMYLESEKASQAERLKQAEKDGNKDKMISAFIAVMLLTNNKSISRINRTTARVYVANYNYTGALIESLVGADLGFIKFGTISKAERLVDSIRDYYDQRAYDRLVDERRLTREITKAIEQGIKKGESILKISKRVQSVSNKSKNRSVMTARTETTRVQGIARQNTYEHAAKMGIELQKRWVATNDSRTRDSHAYMDGETVSVDELFSNGGMEPGDARLAPEERINCRCTSVPEVIK